VIRPSLPGCVASPDRFLATDKTIVNQTTGRALKAPGPSISVVIPTWNGLDLLRDNLPSVLEAMRRYRDRCGGETELIVVDDGSTDETAESFPREFPSANLVLGGTNRGFSGACNLGFAKARHQLVALLNNDVQVEPDYLVYMAEHFSDPDVFAVTAKVFEWDAPIFTTGGRYGRFRRGFWSVYFNYDLNQPKLDPAAGRSELLSFYAIGGFATFDKEKLSQLGGFLEILSPFHWEDVDLSYRGWKRGWRVLYEPRSRARHRTSTTIERHYRNRTVERLSLRNRLLFHWVNLHSPSLVVRHILMVLILCGTRILVMDFDFYRALVSALGQLGEAMRLRRVERAESRRTDQEVRKLLAAFYSTAPIRVYYNQRDVIENHPEYR